MNKLQFLKMIYDMIKNPDLESLNFSMADVHHEGLFSLVIGGKEFGRLTRVFIADSNIYPYDVQLHTHRYPIRLTVIKGQLRHYTAHKAHRLNMANNQIVQLSEFEYKSPLNGGGGLKYLREGNYVLKDYILPIGSSLEMTSSEIHTVSCTFDSIWIVEEQGFETESSLVLGVPFVTDGLYNPPSGFQVNDKCQLVAKEIKKLILDYELV